MNNSLKAVLLSVFVYPGAGHFFLKKQVAGCAFVALFSVPLILLFMEVLNKVNQLIAQIETGSIPLDIVSITNEVSHLSADAHALTTNMYILIAIWIISAIDAYRLGKVKIKS